MLIRISRLFSKWIIKLIRWKNFVCFCANLKIILHVYFCCIRNKRKIQVQQYLSSINSSTSHVFNAHTRVYIHAQHTYIVHNVTKHIIHPQSVKISTKMLNFRKTHDPDDPGETKFRKSWIKLSIEASPVFQRKSVKNREERRKNFTEFEIL